MYITMISESAKVVLHLSEGNEVTECRNWIMRRIILLKVFVAITCTVLMMVLFIIGSAIYIDKPMELVLPPGFKQEDNTAQVNFILNSRPVGYLNAADASGIVWQTFRRQYYVSQPKMENPPPKTIRVGSQVYEVKIKAWMGTYGETNMRAGTIFLAGNQSFTQMQDTLLHEVLHTAMYLGNPRGKTLEDDDDFIWATSPSLLQVLQDNPELVKWLRRRQ